MSFCLLIVVFPCFNLAFFAFSTVGTAATGLAVLGEKRRKNWSFVDWW